MRFILDTNIISRMRRMERTSASFKTWAEQVDYDTVFLSAITVMEIEDGIIPMEHRDEQFASVLRSWREVLLVRFADRILPVDAAVALRCSRLRNIRGVDIADGLIAATAFEHGLTLVTHNVRHFTGFGLDILNPFDP